MKLTDAIRLVTTRHLSDGSSQTWADLGCGIGLFSHALLSVLPKGSTVFAVDRNRTLQVDSTGQINFLQADFEKDILPFHNLDGILMANSLHYIADQSGCLARLNDYLHPRLGKYLLVEYDLRTANSWVPFPLPFTKTEKLFERAGFPQVCKLAEHKSIYHSGNMYSALFSRS